jgi:hypothetical protein
MPFSLWLLDFFFCYFFCFPTLFFFFLPSEKKKQFSGILKIMGRPVREPLLFFLQWPSRTQTTTEVEREREIYDLLPLDSLLLLPWKREMIL